MRCFVSSPYGTDTSVLEQLLAEEHVYVLRTTETGSGALFASQDTELGDVFIAVLALGKGRTLPTAVLIETGIALGKTLPTLLIVPPPAQVPLALGGVTSVNAALGDIDALRLHLRVFLRVVANGPDRGSTVVEVEQPTSSVSDFGRALEAVAALPKGRRGTAFEEIVLDLFREAGATVAPSSTGESGADAAVALPGHATSLGVVLIEAKYGQKTVRAIKSAQAQLQAQVLERGASLGVLVLGGLGDEAFVIQEMPLIVTISAEDLLRGSRGPLAEFLLQARNEAAHRY